MPCRLGFSTQDQENRKLEVSGDELTDAIPELREMSEGDPETRRRDFRGPNILVLTPLEEPNEIVGIECRGWYQDNVLKRSCYGCEHHQK